MSSVFGSVLVTVIIFAVFIFIHEFGHFSAAKLFHIRVDEFSLGMGPAIYKKKGRETLFAVRAIPFGGYVQLEGEEEESDDPRAFCNQKPIKRLVVLLAGAVMNLILGFLIFFFLLLPQETLATNTVSLFKEDAVTAEQGLEIGDIIYSIDGHRVYTTTDIMFYLLNDNSTPSRQITVLRDGSRVDLGEITFTTAPDESGSASLYIDFYVEPLENGFFPTVSAAFCHSVTYGRIIWNSFVDLVAGRVPFGELAGPVGVGSAVSEAMTYGAESVLLLCAMLTINLGIFNLLPIPALDGGRIFFVLIEMIIRRPVNRKYESYVHAIGMIALLTLMAVILCKDIYQIF